MKTKKIKLGMVGGGIGSFIGAVHRIASRIDNRFDLVAGALTSDPQRSRESALELGIEPERSYDSYKAMVISEKNREDGIDAVSIVTPNHMHFPIASAFLEQGIAVICDKPMTLNLNEALELQSLANKSGCFFGLTHNYTGYPLVRFAKELVETGKLGKLRVIQVEYAQDWLTQSEEDIGNKQAEWRTDPERSGAGGSIGDIGTHAFNLACFISGLKVQEISADLSSFVSGRELDDNAHIMLRFEQGVKGMLWSSQVAPGNENNLKIRIFGDQGGLEWIQENPNELRFSPFGQPTQILTRGGHGVSDVANRITRTPSGHPEGYLEGFANIYSDIADILIAIKNNDSPPDHARFIPGINEGVQGLRFIETAVESSKNNSLWVSLNNQ